MYLKRFEIQTKGTKIDSLKNDIVLTFLNKAKLNILKVLYWLY